MHHIVYEVRNTINGKTYIGKHKCKDLNDGYIGSGKYLKHAIRKHGKDNFTRKILFDFDSEQEMNAKEAQLVTEEVCRDDSNYNLKPGGAGGFALVDSKKGRKAADAALLRKYGPDFAKVRIANRVATAESRERSRQQIIEVNNNGSRYDFKKRVVEPDGTIHDSMTDYAAAHKITRNGAWKRLKAGKMQVIRGSDD